MNSQHSHQLGYPMHMCKTLYKIIKFSSLSNLTYIVFDKKKSYFLKYLGKVGSGIFKIYSPLSHQNFSPGDVLALSLQTEDIYLSFLKRKITKIK